MIIKNYKYDFSNGRVSYTIDVDGFELIMEHKKTEYGSVQFSDTEAYLDEISTYDYQEAELIEAFVDFQNNLIMYSIGFELKNAEEVE